ncbi:ABC transporter permease [Sporichthya brevicatena]|uniref:ABC transporter permease n=1 Tax=Sporichthya brevicatena TaxID=171442 RepID=A0ABN1H9B5_9ACTN
MNWAWENRSYIGDLIGEHAILAFVPLLIGLVLALPLGVLVAYSRRSRFPILALCTFLQAIPALTFFIVFPSLLDTKLNDRINVVVGLSLLVLGLLTRAVAEAVVAVPAHVRLAADSMGMSGFARTTKVELPVALPAIVAALRTAAVLCVTLATAAAILGVRGLGTLFIEGYDTGFETEVLVGIALVGLIAFGADVALVRAARFLAPWSKLVTIR